MIMERFAFVFVLCTVSRVSAYSVFRDSIPNGNKVQHPCKSNDIWHGVGHLTQQGGGARNAFGKDFYAEGKQWTQALCQKDSDGDGQTNGQELGDPQCTWTRGGTPQRTTDISHPGFRTPASQYPYNSADKTTLDCSGQYVCPGNDLPDTKKIDLKMSDTKVPSKTTTLFCTTFAIPSDSIYHAISFEPILDNLNVIHHMLLYGCEFNDSIEVGKPAECGMSSDNCRDLLAVWSLGLPGQCAPQEAGVRFGNGSYSYVQLQVHWNNPQNVKTYTDGSGMRMYYTPKLRQHDLGIMWLGQYDIDIPPHTPSTTVESTCKTNCMKELLALGEIQVNSALVHMHNLGSSATIEKIDKDNNIISVVNEPVYDYNTPKWADHKPHIKIGRTDRLKISCTFNSSMRSTRTTYGDATADEMCFGFVQYFPKRGDIRCTQSGAFDSCYYSSTVCGPQCDLSHYMDVAVPALNRALVECKKIPIEGCNQQCSDDTGLLWALLTDNCTKVRHPKAWYAFYDSIQPYLKALEKTVKPCYVDARRAPVLPPRLNTSQLSNVAEVSKNCPVKITGSPAPTMSATGNGSSRLSIPPTTVVLAAVLPLILMQLS